MSSAHNALRTITPVHSHEIDESDEELIEFSSVTIFDATYCGEPVPAGFEAVRILIDGGIKADLSWELQRKAAHAYVAEGLRIFWEIDLGLFDGLLHPLSNRTQFLALSLSLQHFCETLWKEFRKHTIGLCIYRGSLDFSEKHAWDEEQIENFQNWMQTFFPPNGSDSISMKSEGGALRSLFCRDACGEYLSLLSSRISDFIPLFLLFDATGIEDSFLVAQLLTKERYPRFHLAVKNPDTQATQVLGGTIGWEGQPMEKGTISRILNTDFHITRAKLGLSLPGMFSRSSSLLSQALSILQEQKRPFRVIPEGELAVEWDGLDYLVVDSGTVAHQFKRKLQGFCAAGGTVIVLGASLDLAQEISFEQFLKTSI